MKGAAYFVEAVTRSGTPPLMKQMTQRTAKSRHPREQDMGGGTTKPKNPRFHHHPNKKPQIDSEKYTRP